MKRKYMNARRLLTLLLSMVLCFTMTQPMELRATDGQQEEPVEKIEELEEAVKEEESDVVVELQARIDALPSVEDVQKMSDVEKDALMEELGEILEQLDVLLEDENINMEQYEAMALTIMALNDAMIGDNSTWFDTEITTISSVDELEAFRASVNNGNNYSGKTVTLTENLDLSGVENWTPIGNSSNAFKGTFDGGKHVIYNLTINTSSRYCGLFGRLETATVKNLGLENVNVDSSYNDVAGLAGNAKGGIIECCYITGSVKGSCAVSGILGSTHSSSCPTTITNCYARVALINSGYTKDIAGISGWNEATSVKIENCYSACIGEIRPIAGWSDGSAVQNGQFISTYFDKTLSPNFSDSNGRADLGKTSDELKIQSTFSGWDFSSVWAIDSSKNGGYPYLRGFTPGLGGAPGSVTITVKDNDNSPVTDATVVLKKDGVDDVTLSHQGNGVYSGTVTTSGATYDIYVNGEKQGQVTQSGNSAATVSVKAPSIPEGELHQHIWNYSFKDATITATCKNDNTHKETATISVSSSSFPYTGSAITPAEVTYSSGWPRGTLDISYSNNIDVGDSALASIVIDGKKASITFEITAVESSVATAPTPKTGLTYSGGAQALVNAGSGTGGTIKYSIDYNITTKTGTWIENIPTGINAGSYTVWYKVVGDSNHNDTVPANVSVSIGKKEITANGIKAKDKTYDGTTAAELDYSEVSLTGIVSGENLAVTAQGTFDSANKGENKVVNISNISLENVNGNDYLKNYILATNGHQTSATANIRPKDIHVTITSNGGTYGTEITPASAEPIDYVEGHKPVVTLTYTGTANDSTSYSSEDVPTKAGTYTVTAAVADTNYNLTGDTTAQFVVTKASPNLSVNTEFNKTYGDVAFSLNASKAEGSGALSYSVTSGDAVRVDANGTVTILKAGTATITVSVAENDNFVGNSRAITIKVAKKNGTLTVTKVKYEVTYGDADFTIGEINKEGESSTDYKSSNTDVATVDQNGKVSIKNVGETTITLSMDESTNYKQAQTTVQVIVAKKPITVTAVDLTQIYGDEDITLTYTAIGLVPGDVLTGISLSRESGKSVNTYNINVTQAEGANSNYDINFEKGKYTINPREVTLSWSDTVLIYNGQEQMPSASVTNIVGDDVINVTVTGGGTDKGSYTATADSIDNPNYKLPTTKPTQDFTIEEKEITVRITPNGGVFGGFITPAFAEPENYVEGHKPVVYMTYTGTANDGTVYGGANVPEKAGRYTVTVSVSDTNYKLIGITTEDFIIAKADPELSVDATFIKIYGDMDFFLNATKKEGSGALAFTVKSGDAVSVVANGKVTILKAGTTIITVSVDENENFKADSMDVSVTVAPKSITGATVNLGEALIYNGQELTQNVSKVVLDGEEITFTVENNKVTAAGTYELTIKGTGNYSGEIKVKYVIVALDEKVDEIGAGTSGEIKMAVSVGEKAPETTIQSSKSEMIQMVATADELSKVASGDTLNIWLEVKDASNTITEESRQQIADKIKGFIAGHYMDISLFKKLASESGSTQIAETGEPVRIEIEVPEELLNRNSSISRQYAIVRNHGGQVEILPATFNAGTHTLIFETDKFSDYGIIYKDTRIPDNSSSSNDSPQNNEPTYVGTYYPTQPASKPATGDSANAAAWLAILGICFIGLAGTAAHTRKKKNK